MILAPFWGWNCPFWPRFRDLRREIDTDHLQTKSWPPVYKADSCLPSRFECLVPGHPIYLDQWQPLEAFRFSDEMVAFSDASSALSAESPLPATSSFLTAPTSNQENLEKVARNFRSLLVSSDDLEWVDRASKIYGRNLS